MGSRWMPCMSISLKSGASCMQRRHNNAANYAGFAARGRPLLPPPPPPRVSSTTLRAAWPSASARSPWRGAQPPLTRAGPLLTPLLVRGLVLKQQLDRGRVVADLHRQPLGDVPGKLALVTVAQQLARLAQHAAVLVHLREPASPSASRHRQASATWV